MIVTVISDAAAFTQDGRQVVDLNRHPPAERREKMNAAIAVFWSLGWQVVDQRNGKGETTSTAGESEHTADHL